jgi:hypothetical protein
VSREVVDVDEVLWPLDLLLHQVDQRGPAGNVASARECRVYGVLFTAYVAVVKGII